MKFTTASVLVFGATLAGVLAAPMPKGGDIVNVALANMEKREAVAQPDYVHDEFFKIALAASGNPYWCGQPSCGKEKREAVAEPEAIAEPEAHPPIDFFKLGLAASGDPYWCGKPSCGPKKDCGAPFCDEKEKREAVAEPEPEAVPQINFFEVALAASGDPCWCGRPTCGPLKDCGASFCDEKEKRDITDFALSLEARAVESATVVAEPAVEKRDAAPQIEPCGPYECCDASCEPQFPPSKREAAAEPLADVEAEPTVAERDPPAGFPHPKCGSNLCQPYGPPLITRAVTALKEFMKRQYNCGAPFCFGGSKGRGRRPN